METTWFGICPSGNFATTHPINDVIIGLAHGSTIEISDIQILSDRIGKNHTFIETDDDDAHFYLIVRTTPDSLEEMEDLFLEVSASGCSIPSSPINLGKHELEIISIPVGKQKHDRYTIQFSFKTL